jgi:enamine deaminase RidA (YjgF/YER057c/UK114 family)
MGSHSASSVERRLNELGLALPKPAAPVAAYVPYVVTGDLLVVSGQLPLGADGKIDSAHRGKLGGAIFNEAGQAAARVCALNVLAQVKAATGNLDRVRRVVRLGGFINCVPDFNAVPAIMNGASDLIIKVFGERGRHARSTIGVAQLPLDAAVEVEGMFEIDA